MFTDVSALLYLQHEVIGVCLEHQHARVLLRANADSVVLVGQILDTLEVEGLDHTLFAHVVLGAAGRRHEGGWHGAINLGYPESELVAPAAFRGTSMWS